MKGEENSSPFQNDRKMNSRKNEEKKNELHEEVQLWIKELEFIKDEHNFLKQLLSTHFLELSSKSSYDPTKRKIELLKATDQKRKEIQGALLSHDQNIAKLYKSFKEEDLEKLVIEHDKCKQEVKLLELNFRYTKKKIFRVIKDILKAHKQKLLLEESPQV